MRILTIMISGLLISSCVLHDHYQKEILKTATADRVYAINLQGRLTLCEPWIPPYLPPAPPVPNIPEKLQGNPDAEAEILLKSLEIHRRHIKEIRDITRKSYDSYIDKCSKRLADNE